MSKSRIARRCLVALVVLSLTACETPRVTNDQAAAFVAGYTQQCEMIRRHLAFERWGMLTGRGGDSLYYYENLRQELLPFPQTLDRIAAYKNVVRDKDLERKLGIIYKAALGQIGTDDNQLTEITDSLVQTIDSYPFLLAGNPTTKDDLERVLSSSADRTLRRNAFTALYGNGQEFASGLTTLIRWRNQAAGRIGFNSYYEVLLQSQDIASNDLTTLLDRLDELSREPYRQVLDSLRLQSGLDDLQIWDIAYLFNATNIQNRAYLDPTKQIAMAKRTCRGIGFELDAMPIYFDPEHSNAKPGVFEPIAVNIPHDIRIVGKAADSEKSLRSLFSAVGSAVYYAQVDQPDRFDVVPPAPCFDRAMARLFAAFTQTDAWRRTYAAMPEPLVVQNRLKDRFLHLYALRTLLLYVRFEQALYEGGVRDFNQLFWNMFEQYLMLPGVKDIQLWATVRAYVSDPVTIQNDLLAECIARQTLSYLARKYGSIIDNLHTREFLVQNLYRFGRRYDWQTLLYRGTGERLNPGYAIEPVIR